VRNAVRTSSPAGGESSSLGADPSRRQKMDAGADFA
jgi:hypothetical protein